MYLFTNAEDQGAIKSMLSEVNYILRPNNSKKNLTKNRVLGRTDQNNLGLRANFVQNGLV